MCLLGVVQKCNHNVMKTTQTQNHMHISYKILYVFAEIAHHYWIIHRYLKFNNQKIIPHTFVGYAMWYNTYSLAPLAHLIRKIYPSTCKWGFSCCISWGRDRTDTTWWQTFNSKWKRFWDSWANTRFEYFECKHDSMPAETFCILSSP